MKEIPLGERIIFALDYADPKEARSAVQQLDEQIGYFKVGLQLFLADGWPMVDFVLQRGNKVMLDLKLHDIPATVRLAVEQFAGRGISMATVHGYAPVVQAALDAKTDVQILGVTVLTSTGEDEVQELGFSGSVQDLVQQRAKRILDIGCHGLVCSAQEASMLRRECGNDFIMVTPGIRPAGTAAGDQQRITTPAGAIKDGADYLVIGRPIRDAADPSAAIQLIQDEIQAVC